MELSDDFRQTCEMTYVIATSDCPHESVTQEVRALGDRGFRPLGAPFVVGDLILQAALVRQIREAGDQPTY